MDGAGRCQEANRRPGRSSLTTVTCSHPGNRPCCYHSLCAWLVNKQEKELAVGSGLGPEQADCLRVHYHRSGSQGSPIDCKKPSKLKMHQVLTQHSATRPPVPISRLQQVHLELRLPNGAFDHLDQRPRLQDYTGHSGKFFYVKECRSAGVLHLRCRTRKVAEDHGYNTPIDGEVASCSQ